jgi:hypothetical protein
MSAEQRTTWSSTASPSKTSKQLTAKIYGTATLAATVRASLPRPRQFFVGRSFLPQTPRKQTGKARKGDERTNDRRPVVLFPISWLSCFSWLEILFGRTARIGPSPFTFPERLEGCANVFGHHWDDLALRRSRKAWESVQIDLQPIFPS